MMLGDDLEALLEAELERTASGDDGTVSQPAKRSKTEAVCPPHPGFMGGICIRCGALKCASAASPQAVSLKYIHHGLEVSGREAARLRAGTAQRALASRRLLLVLDLDHTLLNSARAADLSAGHTAALHAQLRAQPADAPLLYHLPHMGLWTRLRPGVREFLAAAHELYDLHVFTMGDSDYAAGMTALLDPDGKLFSGRVASSRDAGGTGVKDLDVLLGADELVLVMDDTAAVWPRHSGNLILMERYIYFPPCAAKFGWGGRSLLERAADEDAKEGALVTALCILTEVHTRFFGADGQSAPADVRHHLQLVQRRVLAGCHVLFSRIIPSDCADPTNHPLWRVAVKFGAECHTAMEESVTHVVAGGVTDKTRWAQAAGKHVVNADWLWCSASTWQKADEARFALAGKNDARPPSRLVSDKADLAAALCAAAGGQDTGVQSRVE